VKRLLAAVAICVVAQLAQSALRAQQPEAPGPADTPRSTETPRPADTPRPTFAEFLAGVRTEALARGIRPEVLDQALSHIDEPSAVILERDRTQAEAVQTLEQYVDQRVTKKAVATGREMLARHHDLLEQISARYGVASSVIVGIWGFESNYGRFSGVRPTIAALATLAWDPRRSALFRAELFDALAILNRGDIEPERLKGSWAGAMGQVQFMPSSYLKFAEDFDGDGRRDIWGTPADIFASIANYMKGHGWVDGESWGHEVSATPEVRQRISSEVEQRAGTCRATRDMTAALPVATWQALGVRTTAGESLAPETPDGALVTGAQRAFLVNHNYDALLEYNCSHAYAIGVSLLSDRIAGAATEPQAAKVKSTHPNKHKQKKGQA
jgi:membrane-bound lytic murein transglycosylase B